MCGTVQMQLDTHEQCTCAVRDFYPHSKVQAPAHMHTAGYLLQLCNKRQVQEYVFTILKSLCSYVSLLIHICTYINTMWRSLRTFQLYPTSRHIHHIQWVTIYSLYFERSSVTRFRKLIQPINLFNRSNNWCP